MSEREGPSALISLTCQGCRHEHSLSYRIQGDSGSDVYCSHPSATSDGLPRHIGDTTWQTPEWCPLRKKALAELAAAIGASA